MNQQIALQPRDLRPILHVAVGLGRVDTPILGRKACDGALYVTDRGQVFVEPGLIFLPESLPKRAGIFLHSVEDALLPGNPACIAGTEQTVEKLVRKHLRRKSPVVSGPRHVALDAFSERLL